MLRVRTIDDFVNALPEDVREEFVRLRQLAEQLVPDAEQGTSYGVPALRYRGKPLLGFAAAKSHLSIYPFSPGVVDLVRSRLGGYSVSKGTIRFATDHPLPDDVVTDIVRLRRDEIDGASTT